MVTYVLKEHVSSATGASIMDAVVACCQTLKKEFVSFVMSVFHKS